MINEFELRKQLEEILTVGDTERYMNGIALVDINHIMNEFNKKQNKNGFNGDLRYAVSWLKAVMNNRLADSPPMAGTQSNKKNKSGELSDMSPEEFQRCKTINESAWELALKHPMAKKVIEVFSSLPYEQKVMYQCYGKSHMSYGYEQDNFSWNPLVELGSPEFDEEIDRYNAHMDKVEKGSIVAVLISNYKRGVIGVPNNAVQEKEKRLREVDALSTRIKKVSVGMMPSY